MRETDPDEDDRAFRRFDADDVQVRIGRQQRLVGLGLQDQGEPEGKAISDVVTILAPPGSISAVWLHRRISNWDAC